MKVGTLFDAGRFSGFLSISFDYRRQRVFRRNRTEADDVFDALGDGHVEPDDLVRRHKNQKAGRWIGRRRHKNAHDILFCFLLHFSVLFACDEADRIHSRARKFHEHDGFEGIFIAGERIVDLLDGGVNFIEQRNSQHYGIQPFDHFSAEIISREPPNNADEQNGDQQSDQAPIPIDRIGGGIGVRDAFWQKKQEPIRDAGNRAEQPFDDRNRNDGGQNHGQPGQEIGPPARKQAFLFHAVSLKPC